MAYPLSAAGKAAFLSGIAQHVWIRVSSGENGFAVDDNGVLYGGLTIEPGDLIGGDISLVDDILNGGTGRAFVLTEANIREGGFIIDRFSTAGQLPEIGSCCAAEINLVVDNANGRFDTSAFIGSTMEVNVSVDVGGTTYTVPMGVFNVDSVRKSRNTIEVVGLDSMVAFDKAAVAADYAFPMTVQTLVSRLCTECGVTLSANADLTTLPNYNYTIPAAPAGDNPTCRKWLIWCCQIMGVCGYMDYSGELMLAPYGGTAVDDIDESVRFSGDIAESSITMSGVEVVDADGNGYFAGTDGFYCIISGNGLIQSNYAAIATALYGAIGGWSYYPASIEALPMPWLWPLDTVDFYRGGSSVGTCSLTGTTFALNGRTTLKSAGTSETQTAYAALSPDTAQSEAALGIKLERIRVGYLDAISASIQQLVANDITLKNLAVVDTDGNTVATFNASNVTLGDVNSGHAVIDFNSLELFDADGNLYTSIGDLRDENGEADLVDVGTLDSTLMFTLSASVSSRSDIHAVYLNGAETSFWNLIVSNLVQVPAGQAGDVIKVEYTTTDPVYHFAFGEGRTGSVGRYSLSSGQYQIASGENSATVGGNQNTASGRDAVIVGGKANTVSGEHAVVVGGQSLIASGDDSIVHGRFNVEDTNRLYAEIVGNGNGDNARSNARTLDWNGNEMIAGVLSTLGLALRTAANYDAAWNSTPVGSVAIHNISGLNETVLSVKRSTTDGIQVDLGVNNIWYRGLSGTTWTNWMTITAT